MSQKWILPSHQEAKKRRRTEGTVSFESFTLDDKYKDIGRHRQYSIETYGCQANVRDSENIAGILEAMGFTAANSLEESDLILLNTCSIRENANNRVFSQLGELKHLKQKNPELLIGVCGCMTQEEVVVKKILKTYHQVDLIFGTHNINRLPDLLVQAVLSKERTVEVFSKEGDVIENLPSKRFGEHKAWVNIMYGCDKFCTYCIVPYTRGKERSRLINDILNEVEELIDSGYKEVTLLGQNVNAYGNDLGMEDGFSELLEKVAQKDIERIRFTTSHPWNFTNRMIEVISNYPNIMPFIHLPLQSGNNEILRLMGRRYTVDEYMNVFNKLKEAIPNCSFSTDIIVGFPNETSEQFQDTLDVVDACQFDNVYTFVFSSRPGTPAAKMIDNVSMEEKKERLAILNEKTKKYARMKNDAYKNRIVKVLVDGPSKKDPNIFSGYTETQKLVNFSGCDIRPGQIIDVKITEPKSYFLLGKAI